MRADDRLEEDIERRIAIETKLTQVEQKLDRLQDDVSGLLQAWNTGKGASNFILGCAKLVAAAAVIWAILRSIKWGNII